MSRFALPSILLLGAFLIAVVSGRCHGADSGHNAHGRLLLRISPEAIGQIRHRTFENEQAVDDLVLGTTVKGVAKTTAKCLVEACEENEMSGLRLVVSGTSVTDTEGRNGPAIITSTTTTEFTAIAPLRFDTVEGFKAGEIEVEAESKTETKDIRSTQKGIAGSFVKKLAEKKVKQSLPEAQAIAREMAINRIRGEVAEELEVRLANLNASFARLSPVLSLTRTDANEPMHLVAHNGEVIVCVGADKKPDPSELPKLTAGTELWLLNDRLDAALNEKISRLTQRQTYPVGIGNVSQRPAKTDKRPHLERQGDWWILRSVAATSN